MQPAPVDVAAAETAADVVQDESVAYVDGAVVEAFAGDSHEEGVSALERFLFGEAGEAGACPAVLEHGGRHEICGVDRALPIGQEYAVLGVPVAHKSPAVRYGPGVLAANEGSFVAAGG